MQNHPEKPSNSLKKFLREKGYYIVLALCVAAVGVSGYLFVRTASDQNTLPADTSLSVPLTVPEETTGNKGNSDKTESSSSSASSADTGEPAEDAAGSAELTEDTAETASVATVRPLSGDTIAVFSMDALAYNETTQDWRTHNGIDIAATVGDNVLAARDGVVGAVYEDDAYGTTVTVNHADGYTTYYANLGAETTVEVGQTVKAGDVLGTVGDTATVELAEEGHLHFSVYHNDQPVDPEQFLLS